MNEIARLEQNRNVSELVRQLMLARVRIETLKRERDDAVALIRAAGGTWRGRGAALAAEEKRPHG